MRPLFFCDYGANIELGESAGASSESGVGDRWRDVDRLLLNWRHRNSGRSECRELGWAVSALM